MMHKYVEAIKKHCVLSIPQRFLAAHAMLQEVVAEIIDFLTSSIVLRAVWKSQINDDILYVNSIH